MHILTPWTMKYGLTALVCSLTWTVVTLRSIPHDVICKESCQGNKNCKLRLKIVWFAKHDCMLISTPGSSDRHKLSLSMSSNGDSFTVKWPKRKRRKHVSRYIFMLLLYDTDGHEVLKGRTCYSIEARYRKKHGTQIQNSLYCQGLNAFPTVTNLTTVLFVQTTFQRMQMLKLGYSDRRSPSAVHIVPTTKPAEEDISCSSWTPNNFHVELKYTERIVVLKWEPATVNVEIALMPKDNTDILSYSTLVISGVNTISLTNISSGTYVAVIRPADCFDCYYAEYYNQPCNIDFMSTEPFTFEMQRDTRAGVDESTSLSTVEAKNGAVGKTSTNVIAWVLLAMVIFLITAGIAYFIISSQTCTRYKQLTDGDDRFSKMKRIVLVYSVDCDQHLKDVIFLAKLLEHLGKQVIYPDNDENVKTLRQGLSSWVETQITKQTTETLFVVVYSELLHRIYKEMDFDHKAYQSSCSNNPDPFRYVAPHFLKHLKKNGGNVMVVNFGFRDVNPLQSLSSSYFVLTMESSQNRNNDNTMRKRQINKELVLSLFALDEKSKQWLNSEEGQTFCESFQMNTV